MKRFRLLDHFTARNGLPGLSLKATAFPPFPEGKVEPAIQTHITAEGCVRLFSHGAKRNFAVN